MFGLLNDLNNTPSRGTLWKKAWLIHTFPIATPAKFVQDCIDFVFSICFSFPLFVSSLELLYVIIIFWFQTTPPSEMPSSACFHVLMFILSLPRLLDLLLVIKHGNRKLCIYGWCSLHFPCSTLGHSGDPKMLLYVKILKFCPIHKPLLLGVSRRGVLVPSYALIINNPMYTHFWWLDNHFLFVLPILLIR